MLIQDAFLTMSFYVALALIVPGPTNTLLLSSRLKVGLRGTLPLVIAEALGYVVAISLIYTKARNGNQLDTKRIEEGISGAAFFDDTGISRSRTARIADERRRCGLDDKSGSDHAASQESDAPLDGDRFDYRDSREGCDAPALRAATART